jgi:transcriptional regulator with XRE-family HTH domain
MCSYSCFRFNYKLYVLRDKTLSNEERLMITPRQIRAARGLLGWDAIELGRRTDLRRETIANIEPGRTRASDGSLERIMKAFDSAGVKFTESEGVGLKPEGIETFIGEDRFRAFAEFVYDYLEQYGGDVCVSAPNEAAVRSHRREWTIFVARLQDMAARDNISVCILKAKGKTPSAFCAFGGCFALISFDHEQAPYVALHKSGAFGAAFREVLGVAADDEQTLQIAVLEKRA